MSDRLRCLRIKGGSNCRALTLCAIVDKRALPPWRYAVRQNALPLIRWETPYLAWMQDKLRTPALDSYFAITANLGTHTFFMIGLPMLFWCGYASFGKGYVKTAGSSSCHCARNYIPRVHRC